MTAAPPDLAPSTALRVHHPATAEHLVAVLRECWSGPRADLFDFDLAVVPGPGFQRWLSQQWALADGICAGIEFATLGGLHRRLDADDPWRPERLVWPLQRLALTGDDPELADLRRHLAASREPYSACLRIARQFAGYAVHRPAMLAAWADGQDVDPQGRPLAENGWQARLWRAAAVELGESPVERHARLLAGLRDAPAPGVPHRVAVVAPPQLDQLDLDLLDGLGRHHQVDLLVLTPSPGRWPADGGSRPRREFRRPIGHPLNDALGAVGDERALLLPAPAMTVPTEYPETLLGWLQAGLAADRLAAVPPLLRTDDRSVQVHLSHGPHRQVEVLREVLAAELAADPGLEPREIAVITPDVDQLAPLVTAAFMLPAQAGDHPGHGFRVQLADRSVAQTNPLVGLLLQLLELPDSRFEASTLLDLCAQPAVAARFGFTEDRHDRLVELAERAGIRWGLSAAQRAGYGLGQFPQNTWLAGVQRMLLGVALPETDLVTARTVLPMDDIGSSDVDLVGGLAELLGRLSRLVAAFDSPAPIAEWAVRCRTAVESLVGLAPDQQWQLGDLWAGLAQVAARGDTGPLSRHGALRVISAEFAERPARGSFGAGSLLVAGPASLRHVPHRVIVLLGWDAERYPRPGGRHGDDLLGLQPVTGDPSAGLADRQLLLDALHAARERLIVIARSRSDASNEPVPLAAPLQELLDALDLTADAGSVPVRDRITVSHPLQPFDPGYFDGSRPELTSVDPLAYRGAVAATSTPRPARDRYRLGPLPPPDLAGGVALDDLAAFFVHPARQLLKYRAGLTLAEPREFSDDLPLELDALERWKIGSRVLRQLRTGADPAAVEQAEWLRGEVPPAQLGRRELGQVFADARSALRRAPAEPGPAAVHDLALTLEVPGLGPLGLRGRVLSQGGQLVQVEYSGLQPRHRIEAWLRLLALAVAEQQQPKAIVVGKSRSVALAAPPPEVAAELLGRYLALYRLGLGVPLPALPRVCEALARFRPRSTEAEHPDQIARAVERFWEWDADDTWRAFFRFPALLSIPASEVDLPGPATGEPSLVGALAQLIWTPLLEWEEAR